MPRLNQIIAVSSGKKSRAQKEITEIHHKLQKAAMLEGISRNYRPKDEDGEKLPPEKKLVQMRVEDALADAQETLTELFDVVATQDYANCSAKADVVVNGATILKQVPVTYLLFLEKQMVDMHTFIEKLPTLDPAESWRFDSAVNCYATDAYETTRTKKVLKNHIQYEATKEHPAQVQTYSEDVIVGVWSTIKFSGAIPASEKAVMLGRVHDIQEALKFAREQANGVEVEQVKVGSALFGYLFGKSAS